MLRVLLTPRFAALVLLAVLLAAAFASLGRWQYHRAQSTDLGQTQLDLPPSPLESLILPRTPVPGGDIGRRVTVSGEFAPGEQLVVPDRTPRGIPTGPDDRPVGVWVLAPLVTDSHMVVPVVRGWARNAASVSAPPSGTVAVTGRLFASENSALRDPNTTTTPTGEVDIVSAAELVSLWPGDLLDGFVVADDQQPASPGLTAVTPRGPPPTHGLHWRNAVYAVQWWCFAAFVLYFAFRVVRDEAQRRASGAEASAAPTPPTSSA